MILATRKPDGTVQYFDVKTGMEYKPIRETGKYQRLIPDDVMRFLSPKIESKQGFDKSIPVSPQHVVEKTVRPKHVVVCNSPNKSWFSRILQWLKSLIDGRK